MNTALRGQETFPNQIISEPSPSQTQPPLLAESLSDKQIPVLDGIRAIACLGVILFHLNYESSKQDIWQPLHDIHDWPGTLAYLLAMLGYAGNSGVMLFFLLSGFLLFLPYAKALLFDSSWPSLYHFYIRRTFRILPGYYVALFLIFFFFHPEFLHAKYWYDIWLFLTFRMSIPLSNAVSGPFWTLAIEFQFYLLLPIIAWTFSLIVRGGTLHWHLLKLTLCLLVMLVWGLLAHYPAMSITLISKQDFLIPHALSTAFLSLVNSGLGQFFNEGKYFEVFAIGMLIGMVYTYTRYAASAESWRIRLHHLSPLMFITGLALLAFLSFWYFYTVDTNILFFPKHPRVHVVFTFLNPHISNAILHLWAGWQALAYALGYGLCMLALLYGSARLKRPFESSILRWVASISFSLYMWHSDFLILFARVFVANLQRQGWSPFVQYGAIWCWTFVVIFPVSAMLYQWIEQPGIRLGERLMRKLKR